MIFTGAPKQFGEIESDPAGTQIVRLCGRVAELHVAGVTDRDPIVLPIADLFADDLGELFGSQFRARLEFQLLAEAGAPEFDVGAADIDHESIHNGSVPSMWEAMQENARRSSIPIGSKSLQAVYHCYRLRKNLVR